MDTWEKAEWLRVAEQMSPEERETYTAYLEHELVRLDAARRLTQEKLMLLRDYETNNATRHED